MSTRLRNRSRRADEPVWRALSDPTRRALLDLLREKPRTTGELSALFPTTRFAVMKHLNALESAGLVLSRKTGRERWHHLNAVPIQQLYERWVKPYEALWATSLQRLRNQVELPQGSPRMSAKKTAAFDVSELEMEIAIDAPKKKVWKALLEDCGAWWPKSMYCGANVKRFVLEPKLGGRVYEDWGDGAGLVWFTVIAIDPEKALDLAGHLTKAYGGPATTLVRLGLEERGKQTVLQLSQSQYGRVDESGREMITEGWLAIFEGGLKAHVEKRKSA